MKIAVNKITTTRNACLSLLLWTGVFLCVFPGCGGDGKNQSATTTTSAAVANEIQVSGYVVKGPVNAAAVEIYTVDARGYADQLLDSTVSDEDGSFSLSFAGVPVQPFIVKATGGSYIDEASRQNSELGTDFSLAVVLANGDALTSVSVTPLTTIASKLIPRIIAATPGSIDDAAKTALQRVASVFNLSDIDLAHVIPRDLLTNPLPSADSVDAATLVKNAAIVRYSLALAALSQTLHDQGQSPAGLKSLLATLVAAIPDPRALTAGGGNFSRGFFQNLSALIADFVSSQHLEAQMAVVIAAQALIATTPATSAPSTTTTDDADALKSTSPAKAVPTLTASASQVLMLTGGQVTKLTITNISPRTTATEISAHFPSTWSDVVQDASRCKSLIPGGSCSLTFTSGYFWSHAKISVEIGGTNATAVNVDFSVVAGWGISSDTSNSAIIYSSAFDAAKNLLYVGGQFNRLGPKKYAFTEISATDGTPSSYFTPMVVGTVNAIVEDGNGGWYIAGAFTQVNGRARNNMAHIFSDGVVDPSFDPNIEGTSSRVNAVLRTTDGKTLYFGGDFTTVGGIAHNRLAAVNASTGAVLSSFMPTITNGSINALALSSDGASLYLGGDFTTIGGSTYNRVAAVSAASGVVTAIFNPNVNNTVQALALSADGSSLYLGGLFTAIGGVTSRYSGLVNVSTGSVIPAFAPVLDGAVYALQLSKDGKILYTGGTFSLVGALPFPNLVALNSAYGSIATTFSNQKVNGKVSSLALSSDGATLYIGGAFSSVGGGDAPAVAALSASTGVRSSTFKVPGDPTFPQRINALAVSGASLYLGGSFTLTTVPTYNNAAAIDVVSGEAMSTFNPNVNGAVFTTLLSADAATLYIGGNFTTVGGVARSGLAAIATANGALVSAFAPAISATTSLEINALSFSPDGKTLYFGGHFDKVGGTSHANLAAVDTTSGAPLSAFNPPAVSLSTDASRVNVYAMALSADGATLYFGGKFDKVGSYTSDRMAAVTTANGALVLPFFNFGAFSYQATVKSMMLSRDGESLFVGGDFTSVNGVARNGIAAVDTVRGAPLSNFVPNANGKVYAMTLSANGGYLYLGGDFTTIGGQVYPRVAVVSSDGGVVDSTFNPGANDDVRSIVVSGTTVFLSGKFTGVGGAYVQGFGTIYR